MTTDFRCDVFRKLCSASVIALFLGLFALPEILRSQTTSTIEGTVTDKQGLAVSGAEVRVEGLTAAASRSVTTDGSGAYQIPGLPAGVYKLTVTHEGFIEGSKLLGAVSKGWPAILSGLKSLLETGEVLAIPPAALGKDQYVQG